jgi:cellulose synthase/poly-beta-1,6-N-acetylglucosamine synthase-like glycosyltransferase/peptidoglycan/xylan/chitin deacetylase (PgdA/CDA1 family)
MSKRHATEMIFYDLTQKRKLYFRLLSCAVIFFFTIGFIVVAVSVVGARSATDFLENTRQYYDYYYTPENEKKIALTFDDGPHPVHTRKIMDILLQHDVPATFFLLGQKVIRHEDVVREISENGFDIGSHSFTHSYDVHESEQRLKIELVTTGKLIEKITGEHPLFYRPPFLLNVGIDPTINPYYHEKEEPLLWAARQGYIPVGADIDSKDWLVETSEEIKENILKNIENGHIVLLHDGASSGSKKVVAALDELIEDLRRQGYTFVSVSEVLGITKNIQFENDLVAATNDEMTAGRISELQRFLQQEQNPDLQVTGYYDLPTEEAVDAWQKKHDIDLSHQYVLPTTDETNNGEVSRLQRFLKDEGDDQLAVTGRFDAQTYKAVARWQTQIMGLLPSDPEYGHVLKKTRAAIEEQTKTPLMAPLGKDLSQNGNIMSFLMQLEYIYFDLVASIGPMLFFVVRIILFLMILRISVVFLLLSYSFFRKHRVSSDWEVGVTAVVPAYNEEDNVASTVRSLLKNDIHPLEIIVVNDGSTDNTAGVAQEIIDEHPDVVRLITVKNGGKARALNIGFENAKYEVVVAMDGDTVFAPHTIKKLVRHFIDPEVGAVAGKICVVEKRKILGIFQNIEYIIGQNIEKRAFASVNAVGVIPGPVGAWRRSDVIACGGYSTDTLVEDQDMTLSILKNGKRIIYEPEAIAYTETPPTVRDFVKQRFRWVFGTMQCFWKYKRRLFHLKPFSLGWIVLPNNALYNTVIPLFSPLIDAIFLFALILDPSPNILFMYFLFQLFDLLYASLGFYGERKNWKYLWLLPFQRLFYRFIMYYIIIKSFIKAIEGTHALWNKVKRTGETKMYFDTSLSGFENEVSVKKPCPLPATS